jgi:hypothetical protein
MNIRTHIGKSIFFLGIYLIFFAVIFVQYPLHEALTGNTDSWFYVGAFKLYESYILSLFVDVPIGEALYPSGPGFMYGDPCFFGALLYRPFCWLGMNELWAWCSMLVVVYATNAFGAYLFFGNWAKKNLTAFWAGLALGASVFSFGNMDSPNAFYLGTMFFCLHYSNKFLNGGRWKFLMLAVLFGASTLYFSAYIFVFQALLLLFIWVYYHGKVLALDGLIRKLASAIVLALFLVAPYLFGFLWAPEGISSAWNPVDSFNMIDKLSLDLPDLVRTLEGNLIYPILKDGLQDHPFFYAQHAVFPGILFFVLAVVGYFTAPSRSRVWLVLSVIGFVMAIGPCIHIAGVRIPMPMEILYKYAGLDGSIRNPVRLWYLVLIGLIGLTLPAIDKLLDRPRGILLLLLVVGVYVLENVPFKAPKYNATAYVFPDKGYMDVLATEPDAVLLELPSAVYTRGEWPRGLNEFSREYIYMFWQTKHHLNLVNGCNGFLPVTRLVLDDMLCRLVDDNTLSQLAQQFGVSVVIFHKNLTLLEDDKRTEAYIRNHDGLQKELETPNTIIYRIKPLP